MCSLKFIALKKLEVADQQGVVSRDHRPKRCSKLKTLF